MTIFFNRADKSIWSVPYKNVHKIILKDKSITIYYYDGSFYDCGGFACPQINTVCLNYDSNKMARKAMQDFFICLTKNVQAFKF